MARLTLLLTLSLLLVAFVAADKVTVRNVERTIDLTSQLATHTINISFLNAGSEPIREFEYTVQEPLASKLSFITAHEGSVAVSVGAATPKATANGDRYVLYKIQLSRPLEPQATSSLKIVNIFTRTMSPYPVAIKQNEGQLVRYKDNHYFFSPYTVLSQETKVQLPSVKVAAYSKQKPALLKGDQLRYGPYVEIAPFTHSNMTVHFENNSPFVAITSLVRELEISQWGNLAVEETYEMTHEGAKFTGPFNRFEFQRLGAPSAVNRINRKLPPSSADIYYRDVIGNISTSHVSTNKDGSVKLELIPRFPLFGGWNIAYYIGYNLPLANYLFSSYDDSAQLVLNVSFAITTNNLFVDDYTLRIIFPEGATDITLPETPFPVDSVTRDSHFTYLDVTGRPVLVIKKKNIVNEHDQNIVVLYRFSKISMLQEPLLLISAVFAILFSFIVISRIDLSVTYKEPEVQREYSPQTKKTLSQVEKNIEKHENIYAELEKTAKAGFVEVKAKAEKELAHLNKELIEHATHLAKTDEPVFSEAVKKLEGLERERLKLKVILAEANHNKKNVKVPEIQGEVSRIETDIERILEQIDVE